MSDCEHKRLGFNISAQTSVMNIAFHFFGLKCEDCDAQWDVGDLAAAVANQNTYKKALIEIREAAIEVEEGDNLTLVPFWIIDKCDKALRKEIDKYEKEKEAFFCNKHGVYYEDKCLYCERNESKQSDQSGLA